MASFTLFLLLLLIATFSAISISEAQSSFSFTTSTKDPNFALYGDANLDGSTIQIAADSVSHGGGGGDGGGRVVYNKPIKYIGFVGTKTEYTAGFSTSFSFSINGGGSLSFVLFSVNRTIDNSLFEVKFETLDSNVGVVVDVDSVFNKIRNFTVSNSDKKEKEKEEKKKKLFVWVNYLGGGKFLEVRVSESKSYNESVDPMMFYRTDLSEMLKGEEEFMVGLKSYRGSFKIHSWSLETRLVSKSMHSYVPLLVEKEEEEEAKKNKKRRETMWEIVTCFIMTCGSIGLVFFGLMHIWTAFKRNNLVMARKMMSPEECGLKTKEFEYEKMEKIEVAMK